MLLDQQLTVHTNHESLTYAHTNFSSDCVLRQQLVIEEFSAEFFISQEKERSGRCPVQIRLISAGADQFEEYFMKKEFLRWI